MFHECFHRFHYFCLKSVYFLFFISFIFFLRLRTNGIWFIPRTAPGVGFDNLTANKKLEVAKAQISQHEISTSPARHRSWHGGSSNDFCFQHCRVEWNGHTDRGWKGGAEKWGFWSEGPKVLGMRRAWLREWGKKTIWKGQEKLNTNKKVLKFAKEI